jgi:hypothetical protein
MRKAVIISKILLLTGLIVIQAGLTLGQEHKPYNAFNIEAELERFIERGGKVEEISTDVYRLTNRIGESKVYYFNSKGYVNENKEDINTTIINVWEIDTTMFAGMFTFWQKVQVANFLWSPLPIEDLNNNSRPELYGFTDVINPNIAGPVRIYERNLNGIYQSIFSYELPTAFVKGIADINNDGNKEIVILAIIDEDSTLYYYQVYKSDSTGDLPTSFDFLFYLDSLNVPFDLYQINDMKFGDWDNNRITDCVFTTAGIWDTTMCLIVEYREDINNFEKVFRFSSIYESDLSGFAVDDFDEDGKTELVISSGPGNVFVIENIDENEYSIINRFPFPIPNTYMQTMSKDIDGNGKSEFWIGGQDFQEGITAFQCYEAGGDNNYNAVARIELRYINSLSGSETIQAVDIDDDGKEELIINIGNVILILKFVGSPNNHQYELWFAKLGESTQPDAEFYPVAIADLDSDGKKDIVIPMTKYTPAVYYAFSYILKQDKTNGQSELQSLSDNIPIESVFTNPNPFNLESTMSFYVKETSNVQIKIFDLLGKEINTLLNKELLPGNYNLSWKAKDNFGNSLPSGVYLIVLKTKNSIKTFKSVLLK